MNACGGAGDSHRITSILTNVDLLLTQETTWKKNIFDKENQIKAFENIQNCNILNSTVRKEKFVTIYVKIFYHILKLSKKQ